MIKVEKIVKYVLIISLTAVLAMGGYITYVRFPTGTDFELTNPPAERLEELIALTNHERTINPNLYAASTFQPNDPLFNAIIAIQQSRWHDARELLKPLVEKGDANAMFWLADITYRSSTFSGREGAELFEKSAKLGNPYAALKLSPKFNPYQCKMRMGAYCDEQWSDIGLDILKKKAENGDVKSAYSYLLYTRFDDKSFDYFDQFLDVVKQSIEIKYYRPLRHLVYMYQQRENLNPYNRNIIPLKDEDRKVLAKLLMIAASDNDILSIYLLNNEYMDVLPYQNDFDNLVKNNLSSLDRNHYLIIYNYSIRLFKQKDDRSYLINGYAYALLFDNWENSSRNKSIYEREIKDAGIVPLSTSEKESAEIVYNNFSDNNHFSAYIDEVRDAWETPLDGY